MKLKPEIEKNTSTEEKIKEAAKRVFTKKGYAATRTRDIAEESGYNLALINYYFRSKEKLFDIIMLEHLHVFIHSVMGIVNDPDTSFRQKIQLLIDHYIDMLKGNPDLPLFMLSEINADPKKLIAKLGFNKASSGSLVLMKQWKELEAAGKGPSFNPLHMVLNVLALTIFPFAASPLLRNRLNLSTDEFNALMEERKKLIPLWVNSMLAT
jgi:AcrR family transcriptional regulator